MKFIHCYENSSYALTTDGKLHYWGDIHINKNLVSDLKIKRFFELRYLGLILTEDGLLYELNIEENRIKQIESDVKFFDMNSIVHIFALQSDECIYEIQISKESHEVNGLKKTDYLNFYDYYLHEYNILFKTIHITNDGYLMTKEIKFNENYNKTTDKRVSAL